MPEIEHGGPKLGLRVGTPERTPGLGGRVHIVAEEPRRKALKKPRLAVAAQKREGRLPESRHGVPVRVFPEGLRLKPERLCLTLVLPLQHAALSWCSA